MKPETLSTQIKLHGLSQPGANLSNWGGNWTPQTDLSNSTDLHHIKLAYDIHQCYHNLYHRFHNPHTKYPSNCGKGKACRSCHNNGNRRACLRSQPWEFTIHHQQTFAGTKNPIAHARISICREVAFIFEGTLCSLKITCSLHLTHHYNNDGGHLSTTQCIICVGNSLWYGIEALHKHMHNEWQMGCQPIAKLRFHKGQNKKTSLIFHTTNHLHHN